MKARPHLGHAYSTIVCDAIARRKRAIGIDTWFLTGTDEHGQKIERSAAARRPHPAEVCRRISAEFRGLWDRLGLTYDDFIRTTKPATTEACSASSRPYATKATYTRVSTPANTASPTKPTSTALPVRCARIAADFTETVSEENYFFKLSAFERKLLEFL